MAASAIPRLTEEEYLARERAASEKSECVHGEIFAMAGGSLRHGLLSSNFIAPCRVDRKDFVASRMKAPI